MLTIVTFGEFNMFKIVFCTGGLYAAFPLCSGENFSRSWLMTYHQSAVVKNALR